MLSIIVPVYNEEKNIYTFLNNLKNLNFVNEKEIIIVNDASTDKTIEILNKIEDLKIINNLSNKGYGFSLKRGIKEAKYDTIVIIDGDNTYNIEDISRLYYEYNKGYDLVVGKRVGPNLNSGFFKSILRKILKLIVSFAAEGDVKDPNSGLRIFSKKECIKYFDKLSNRFSFTTSQSIIYFLNQKFVKYIDIDYNIRLGVTKVKLFKDSLKTLFYIIKSINSFNPLKLFILISLVLLCMSLLLFFLTFVLKLTIFYYLGIVSILLSLLILSIGLLADKLNK